MNSIYNIQDDVLRVLKGKIPDFYLTGGTALSRCYFHHRRSDDLDFFTREFSLKRINEVKTIIENSPGFSLNLIAEQTSERFVKMVVYNVRRDSEDVNLKIDFVEDYLDCRFPVKTVDGINVHAIEDIYIRKIYTVVGRIPGLDETGRLKPTGRNAPKDFYDLYILSSVFRPLNDFILEYCERMTRELLVRWFRTFDRTEMKTGLLDLKTEQKIDYREIENYFQSEVDLILEEEIDI